MRPQARLLPAASASADPRLHLQHGPIDLVIEAIAAAQSSPHRGEAESSADAIDRVRGLRRPDIGQPPHPVDRRSTRPLSAGERVCSSIVSPNADVAQAYRAASARFATILDELCGELPLLRQPAAADRTTLQGRVARRMWAAVGPFAGDGFVTPMAAVAGAVAEEVLAAMTGAADLRRASVNNGGDIALHLAPGEQTRIGLVDRPDHPALFGTTTIRAGDGIGGIATSGWRGRSFSLGIADAVTVLARTAAEADAAATIIANAVDLPGHPAIRRLPACEVQHESDLGTRLVTRDVGTLGRAEIEAALMEGLAKAEELAARGLIKAAALHLQGVTCVTSGAPIRGQFRGGHLALNGNNHPPHAEVAGAAGPRSTQDRLASFEARLRRAPRDEDARNCGLPHMAKAAA